MDKRGPCPAASQRQPGAVQPVTASGFRVLLLGDCPGAEALLKRCFPDIHIVSADTTGDTREENHLLLVRASASHPKRTMQQLSLQGLPIVALLDDDDPAAAERARHRLGADDVLHLPLRENELRRVLGPLLSTTGIPSLASVLVVDDDELTREIITIALDLRYRLLSVSSASEALHVLAAQGVDIMLTDIRLEGMDGLTLIERARLIQPALTTIVMTGFASKDLAVQALQHGAIEFLEKPLTVARISRAVARAWREKGVDLRNQALMNRLRKKNRILKAQRQITADTLQQLEQANASLARELAQRKASENRLALSESRFRSVAELAQVGICTLDEKGQCSYANDTLCRMFGAGVEALTRDGWLSRVHEDDRAKVGKQFSGCRGAATPFRAECRISSTDQSLRWVMLQAAPQLDAAGRLQGYVACCTDITAQRERQDQRLQSALEQRDQLVREVHHRIKNNLQGVIGLLNQRRNDGSDKENALAACVAQVNAIAVAVGLQAEPNSGEHIDIGNLLDSIAGQAETVYGIRVSLNTTKPSIIGRLCGNEAVPVALVLNELLVNAIKHCGASTDGITLCSRRRGEKLRVALSSPGARLPPDFDFAAGCGLGTGLRLVKSLIPQHGVRVSYRQKKSTLETVLELGPPVLILANNAEAN